MLVRDSWAILRLEDGNRDTLGSKRLLDVVLVLSEHFLDIVVKMKLDLLVCIAAAAGVDPSLVQIVSISRSDCVDFSCLAVLTSTVANKKDDRVGQTGLQTVSDEH